MRARRGLTAAGATTVAAVAAVALRPDLPTLAAALEQPAGLDRAVAPLAAAVLWLLAVWFLLAVGVAAATRLPGLAGRVAGRAATVLVPRVLRGLLVGSVATGLVLGPATGALATPRPGPSAVAATWVAPGPTSPRAPAPAWPTDPPPTSVPATPTPASPTGAVTVTPGDSLWSVAAADLRRRTGHAPRDATVAAAWPRWYGANRAVVGDDPALVLPGQQLVPPGPVTPSGGPA